MGIGASLAFIAVGAVLAFATRFTISGIDIQMIGWILIFVGLVGMAFTLMYARPRRRTKVADVVDDEPYYVVKPEEPAPHPGPAEPHVHVEHHTHEVPHTRLEPPVHEVPGEGGEPPRRESTHRYAETYTYDGPQETPEPHAGEQRAGEMQARTGRRGPR